MTGLRKLIAALFASSLVAATGILHGQTRQDPDGVGALAREAPVGYVGSAACADCHPRQFESWRVSHHARAMAEAAPNTVLGDFANRQAEAGSSRATFSRDGARYVIQTEDRSGKPVPFSIDYTFGWEPLQQYLTRFPDGRVQALPWAWDTRPASDGGQRWFHVYGESGMSAGEPLHWTGRDYTWNFMCAECHSTAVSKGYDAVANAYRTTWSEISVGCESCHGPAAGHVGWARSDPRRSDVELKGFQSVAARRPAPDWTPNPATGSPAHGVPRPTGDEVETCARCHSRRSTISEDWKPGRPLEDTHTPSLLTQGLFAADGQMLDEVFNDQSFKQSLMYAKGVVCSDCHDPHSGKLKAAGAEVCSGCHLAERFATKAHSGHDAGSGAPDCIACHMPAKTYLVVDKRHDHSFRIPRPDVSTTIGTPNTCNACHANETPAWAANAIERWHGPARKGFQTFAQAFHFAREGNPAAREPLIRIAKDASMPAIVRATAIGELESFPSTAADTALRAGLVDPAPITRIAALHAIADRPPATKFAWASKLLDDPVLGVRAEAGRTLADMRTADAPSAARTSLAAAFAAYEATQRLNADRPEGRANLASFLMRRGESAAAEAELLKGLALDPKDVELAINLADLYRLSGRDDAAQQTLRSTLSLSPRSASARHALGLTLVRLKRNAEALEQFASAADLDPANARFAYVYGVALLSAKRADEARTVWTRSLQAHPWNAEILAALLNDALRRSDLAGASPLAQRLAALQPDNADVTRLAERLKR
jgi:predicted CXXCH cytochrome family protein